MSESSWGAEPESSNTTGTPASGEGPRPASRRRSRRWIVAGCVLLALYAVGGFVGVPWAAARWIVPAIDGAFAGSLSVASIAFNPFTFALDIGRTSLRDPGGEEVVGFERTRVNFDPLASLLTASWRFAEFTIDRPMLAVTIDEQGETGLLAALAPANPAPAPPDAPREPLLRRIPVVRVDHGGIIDATLRLQDRSGPRQFEIEWQGASIDFGRLDSAAMRRSPHRLVATASNGARVEWTGSITSEPFSIRGEIRLSDMPLAPLMPYIALATTAEVVGGTLHSSLDYEIAPLDSPPTARLTLHDSSIDHLRVMDGDTMLVDAPRFRMVGARVDLASRSVVVPSIRLSDGELHLVRDESGQPAILRLFPWAAAEAAATAHSDSEEPSTAAPEYPIERVAAALVAIVRRSTQGWNATIESVALHHQTLRYSDRSTRRPVETGLSDLELTAGPIRSADRFATPFELRGRMGDEGAVAMRGSIRPLDTDLELALDASSVALAPFAPYLPERPVPELGATNLGAGAFTGKGEVSSRVEWATGRIAVTWQGRAEVDGLRMDLTERRAVLSSIGSLAADGALAAEIAPETGAKLEWNGEASVEALSLDAPLAASPVTASLEGTTARGRLLLHHSDATGVSADWNGSSAMRALDARVAPKDADTVSMKLASAGHDGTVQARVPAHAADDRPPITISHAGRAEFGALDLALGTKGRGRDLRAASGSLDGTIDASLRSDGLVAVVGQVASAVTTLALEDRASLAEPVTAAIGSVRHRGRIDADLGGAARLALRSASATELESLSIRTSLPETGPIDLAAAMIRHDGAAAAKGPSDAAPAGIELGGNADGRGLRLDAPSLDEITIEVREWSASELALESAAPRAVIREIVVNGARATASRVLIPPPADDASAVTEQPTPGQTVSDAEASADHRARAGAAPGDAAESRSATLPELSIARFRLQDGALIVTDPSMKPPARVSLSKVRAEVDDLSTRGSAPARFNADGLVEDSARFEVRGSMLPLEIERATTVDFTLASLPLKPYDPVSNRFVGYEIESGRLTVALPVRVQDSMLEGTLDAKLDRFYLGRETPSPEAPNLPIKLGLDLLRDGQERIAVNIPFKGDLRDPSFDLGPLVWQAVINLLLKATTAPFTLLGALVGAGDRDLSQVVFEPGSAELGPEALADLDLLAQAMAQRPAIAARAIGSIAEPADSQALRAAALRARLRSESRLPADAGIDSDEYLRAVTRAFRDLPRATRDAAESKAAGRSLTREEMEAALAASIELDPAALASLASARAEAVVRALTEGAGLPAERIAAEVAEAPSEGAPRVTFDLR